MRPNVCPPIFGLTFVVYVMIPWLLFIRSARRSPWDATGVGSPTIHSPSPRPLNGPSKFRSTTWYTYAYATWWSHSTRNAPSLQTHGSRWTTPPRGGTSGYAAPGYAPYAWHGRSATPRISAWDGITSGWDATAIWPRFVFIFVKLSSVNQII